MGRCKWYGYIKAVLRDVPRMRADLSAKREPSLTAQYGGCGGNSGSTSNPTACAALRTLSPQEQRELDAVEWALVHTDRRTGTLVELVYFKQSHTLTGAAFEVGYSYAHAKRLQERFFRLVAQKLGVL